MSAASLAKLPVGYHHRRWRGYQMDLWVFFQQFWTSFRTELSFYEQVMAIAAPLAGYTTALFLFLRRRFRRIEKDALDRLEEAEGQKLKWLQAYNAAAAELRELRRGLPENWLADAEKEFAGGNNVRALGGLRDRFADAGPAIAAAADRLSEYHISVADELGDDHLGEARRYARIAALLGRDSAVRMNLLAELDFRTDGLEAAQPSALAGGWDDLYRAFPVADEAGAYVRELIIRARKEESKGRLMTAFRMAERARAIASQSLPAGHKVELIVRHTHIGYLESIGFPQAALDEVRRLKADTAKAFPTDYENNFACAYLEARILTTLDRLPEAGALCEALKRQIGKTITADHPHSLALAMLLAEIHLAAGCIPQASSLLREIGEAAEKLSADNPERYRFSVLKVSCMIGEARTREAFERAGEEIARAVSNGMSDSRSVPHLRLLKAEALQLLGERDAAIAELGELHAALEWPLTTSDIYRRVIELREELTAG